MSAPAEAHEPQRETHRVIKRSDSSSSSSGSRGSSSSESDGDVSAGEIEAIEHTAEHTSEAPALAAVRQPSAQFSRSSASIAEVEKAPSGDSSRHNAKASSNSHGDDSSISRRDSTSTSRDTRRLLQYLLDLHGQASLGVLANTHMRMSHSPEVYGAPDPERRGSLHHLSLALADLAAAAVDAPKTGRAVRLPRKLRCFLIPHFLSRHRRKHPEFAEVHGERTVLEDKIFVSESLLGCLFNRVAAACLSRQPLYISPYMQQTGA